MNAYPWTALVSVLALIVYARTVFAAGRARRRFGVVAPSTDGPPEFQRALRIQANTLEQIALFLPALWLCAAFWGDRWSAAIGVVWPVARIAYALAYSENPAKRGPGFLAGLIAASILLVGAAIGAIGRLL